MDPLEMVKLSTLMEHVEGRPEIAVAVLDGPISINHSDLAGGNAREVKPGLPTASTDTISGASKHGTFVAGILSAKRGSFAPGICPGCTLLIHPILSDYSPTTSALPSATSEQLASAILD